MKGKRTLFLGVILCISGLSFVFAIAETTSPPAKTKVIELRFADWSPPQSPIGETDKLWANRIEEKSNGRIKVTCFFAESLAKMSEQYRACQGGVSDMAYYTIGTDPGKHDLNNVLSLPFMGLTSMSMGTSLMEKLFNKFPEMQAQWQGVKPMGFRFMPPFQFHFTKKAVHSPKDIKGLKMIVSGQWVEVVSNAGGAPLNMGIGDWYMSLERGLAEGQITHFPVCYTFKLLDLFKYHTVFGEGGCGMSPDLFLANHDFWKSLPVDLQKIIEDATRYRVEEILRRNISDIQRAEDYARKKGNTFFNITPEDFVMWQEVAKKTHEKWIADQEAKGLPGKAVYDEARRLIKEYTTTK